MTHALAQQLPHGLAALKLGPAGWWGIALALVLGAVAFWLYRRQLHDAGPLRQSLLPSLRALAVVAIALMIAQPSLFRSETFTQRGQVVILSDASASMSVADPQASAAHKLLAAKALNLTDTTGIDWTLPELAGRIRTLRLDADTALEATQVSENGKPGDVRALLARETAALNEALASLDPRLVGAAEVRGTALMELWTDVPGRSLADIDRDDVFNRAPDERTSISSLRLPANVGDNFARRIRGRLHPPEDGTYVFHLAADTSAALLLSPDEEPSRLRAILRVPQRTDPEDLSKVSQAVRLEAGRSYAFELRHKEGERDDHLTLAWSRDGGAAQVIEKADLSSPAGLVQPEARRDELARNFADQVASPAAALTDAAPESQDAAAQEIIASLLEWESQFRELFEAYAADALARGEPQAVTAAAAFDSVSRADRAGRIVESARQEQSLAAALQGTSDVEVRTTSVGAPAIPLREGSGADESVAEHAGTDLAAALAGIEPSEDRRQAVVLLSDGRHNTGAAPAEAAASLGRREVAIYPVLVGSPLAPPDLTVLEVVGPAAVHKDDQVTGRIVLLDAMPPGSAFTLRISDGETKLWEKELETTGRGRREIEFAFKIDDAAESRLPPQQRGMKFNELLLPLTASADVVNGEMQEANNTGELPVRVTLGTGKMLIIDGRPRWDSRYIASLLGRDKRWEIHEVLGPAPGGRTLPRGEGGLPRSREELFEYDVIVLGEVPVEWWRGDELAWLADFVDERGGGLIVIDGMRQALRDYAGTPLDRVLPVMREDGPPLRVASLDLTVPGAARDALRLEPESSRNAQLWQNLPAPRWIMPVSPLPGGEVLLEAATDDGTKLPAIVASRVGRGRVWYQAFDETWRWRKDAENRWQSRYWSGVANRIMEPPFAVEDKFVALGVEQAAVELGEKISVRARLKDEQGRLISGEAAGTIAASAVLLKNGARVGEARLTPDASGGGLFRADITAPRDAGAYEVAVTADIYSEAQLSARAGVLVRRPAASGELARLDADEPLMRQLADVSGGRFLREYEAGELPDLLSDLSRSRTVTSEYDIWTSWPLFSLAVLLLGTEWLIRRRTGML